MQMTFRWLTPIASLQLRMTVEQIECLQGLPILHVHGTKDWMFPVHFARSADEKASKILGKDGWKFVELQDWTHASPSAVNEEVRASSSRDSLVHCSRWPFFESLLLLLLWLHHAGDLPILVPTSVRRLGLGRRCYLE
jgi:hypothetical protein